MRKNDTTSSRHAPQAPDVFLLEIGRDADKLSIGLSSQSSGERHTVRQVEALRVPMQRIDERCHQLVNTLNAANRKGRLTSGLLNRLKEAGQLLRDDLLSSRIKAMLNTGDIRHLILSLDEHLIHIPWELLHDGEAFLCHRFAVGRIVRTRRPVIVTRERNLSGPLHFLILADPSGDLHAAYNEGVAIRDHVERLKTPVQITFRSGSVTADYIRSKLRDFDMVHFAGHADYDTERPEISGWRLGRERLTAAYVAKMAGTGTMPSLVFANACQSARTNLPGVYGDYQACIFGLANAFILAGVKHYLGTFWEISDESSQRFASLFYRHLFSGRTIGTALQSARQEMIETLGEPNIIWASYLLYGDPTTIYLPRDAAHEDAVDEPVEARPADNENAPAGLRAPEDIIHFTSRKGIKQTRAVFVGVCVVLLVALAGMIWSAVRSADVRQYEQQALAAFNAGDYNRTIDACRKLQSRKPHRCLSYLMLGNVYFTQGRLDSARAFFQEAISSRQGSSREKAEALIGLGRIASVNNQVDHALAYYRQAAELAPSLERPYLSQAMMLERRGDLTQAEQLLQKARSVSRDPDTIDALCRQIRAKASLISDQQRMARIDRMIRELNTQVQTRSPADGSTAAPDDMLTLWLMDFETVGYHLQEGRSLMLTSACTELLMQEPRIKVVERALLDKIMDELKLGTSQLVEQPSLISLGRLVAARFIVFGRLVYDGAVTQASLRCVDVETGEIKAVVNADFDTAAPVSQIASHLVNSLKAKLGKYYPLSPSKISGQKMLSDGLG